MSNPSHIKKGIEPANPFTPHLTCLAPEQLSYVTTQFWYLKRNFGARLIYNNDVQFITTVGNFTTVLCNFIAEVCNS
jgi:hypothetical protein